MSTKLKVFNITGDFTLPNINKWKKEFSEAIVSQKKVMISLGQARDIDLAGIQLLYAVRKSGDHANIEVHFTGSVPHLISERLVDSGFIPEAVADGQSLEKNLRGYGAIHA